jgi:LytS/YehU family sensor histidine kinase
MLSLLAAFVATTAMMAILYVFSHPAFSQDNAQPEQIFIYNLFLMWLFLFIWTGMYLFITRQRQVDALSHQQLHLQSNLQQSQLHALLNQLNPHFMFNCINNIRALILEDSHKAREMLAHMADMLRYNLQDQQQAQETIENELAIANAYMQLASIQFESRLSFTQNVNTAVNTQWFIPRMLIQLLLENAVKHGIAHLPQGGEVSLKLWSTQTDLHIAVTNHGHLQQNPDQGIGLQNIRSRLSMLYGTQASFTLSQQNDKVQALTTIPINKVIEVASSHS